jgi:hypothetical protein
MSTQALERLTAWLACDDNEPWPGDTELHGARGARGRLVQWTCDDGHIITDTVGWGYNVDERAVAHIGQECVCLYAIASARHALAYVRFNDGVRAYVYTSDCVFD